MAVHWKNDSKKGTAARREIPWFLVTVLLGGFVIGFGFRTWMPPPGAMPAKPTPSKIEAPNPAPTARPTTAENVAPVDPAKDHIRGPKDASITVIEYSDFQCPFCKRFHPVLEELLKNDDDVQWVYRHFPLPIHSRAQKAAEASECVASLAGEDAFWKMADAMFAASNFDDDSLAKAAVASGANEAKFRECLSSGAMADVVKEDNDSGRKAGITGTPGSIVIYNPTGTNQIVRGAKQLPSVQGTIRQLRSGKGVAASSAAATQIVKVAIDQGVFTPATVTLSQNSISILEFSAKGLPVQVSIPGLKLRTDVGLDQPKRIRVQTGTTGTFKDSTEKFTVTIAP